jgi:glycosyltransferase involved in cell wall biosynthesis
LVTRTQRWFAEWLAAPSPFVPLTGGRPMPRAALAAWLVFPEDLQRPLNLGEDTGRARLLEWWDGAGAGTFALVDPDPAWLAAAQSPAPGVEQDMPLPITRAMHALHRFRNDLKSGFDLATRLGRWHYVMWFLGDGAREYPRLRYSDALVEQVVATPASRIEQDAPLPITPAMQGLREAREDLRQAYDLATPQGRYGLVEWFRLHAPLEYPALAYTRAVIEAATTRAAVAVDDTPLPITRAMLSIHRMRADLRAAFDLGTAEGRWNYVGWFLAHGENEHQGYAYPRRLVDAALGDPSADVVQDAPRPITRAMLAIYRMRPDVRAAFDLATPGGRLAFVQWFVEHGEREHPMCAYPAQRSAAVEKSTGVAPQPVPTGVADDVTRGGVNIVGLPQAELGIGEDARMAAASCLAAQLPMALIEAPISIESRQRDAMYAQYIIPKPRYDVNLVFLPPIETMRLIVEGKTRPLAAPYAVGCWPWELARWPGIAADVFDVVDEVWAISRFAAEAFREHARVPVVVMPLAVAVPEGIAADRPAYGIDADAFVFLFVFDSLSRIARKNPQACLQAFKTAFPSSRRDDVRLVIKTMNADLSDPQWRAFLAQCDDPRITVKNAAYTRRETLGLFASCDAFVSLHRAEGFGRGIAEAMLLEKPVIVSRYSGNLDFTTDDNAYLVDGREIAVQPGEYLLEREQFWFDADVDAAAHAMRACFEDTARTRRYARAGRETIARAHAPHVVGAAYRARLQALGLL